MITDSQSCLIVAQWVANVAGKTNRRWRDEIEGFTDKT